MVNPEMATVTSIETQKNDTERVSVFLDGRFGFGVSLLVAMAHGLTTGRELSDDEIEAIRGDEDAERAYGATLNFLSFRPRSEREIADYLRKRGLEPALIEAVVSRLERAGLLDDRAFARFWLENRQQFRPRGAMALRSELRGKGLSTEIVEETLDDLGDEEEAAYQAGQKRARTLAGAEEREYLRKLSQFLQRRGFNYSDAMAAARRLAAENGYSSPD